MTIYEYLTVKEKFVLSARLIGAPISEIAETLSLSKSRVREIEEKAWRNK